MDRPSHQQQSRVFLAQAEEELGKEDLRQASEKGWGAASQMVKAVADARGWSHGRHGSLFQAVRRLAEETDDEELSLLFGAASELHTNFYDGYLDPENVEVHLHRVARFVEKMDAILASP